MRGMERHGEAEGRREKYKLRLVVQSREKGGNVQQDQAAADRSSASRSSRSSKTERSGCRIITNEVHSNAYVHLRAVILS